MFLLDLVGFVWIVMNTRLGFLDEKLGDIILVVNNCKRLWKIVRKWGILVNWSEKKSYYEEYVANHKRKIFGSVVMC